MCGLPLKTVDERDMNTRLVKKSTTPLECMGGIIFRSLLHIVVHSIVGRRNIPDWIKKGEEREREEMRLWETGTAATPPPPSSSTATALLTSCIIIMREKPRIFLLIIPSKIYSRRERDERVRRSETSWNSERRRRCGFFSYIIYFMH